MTDFQKRARKQRKLRSRAQKQDKVTRHDQKRRRHNREVAAKERK